MFFLQSLKLIKTANCYIDLSYKIIEIDLKKIIPCYFFPQQECQRQYLTSSAEFWIDSVCCHILPHKNINYMQHFLIQIYRETSDSFRWFAVLVVTSISQHTEHLTLYGTHGCTWHTQFFYCVLCQVKNFF